MAKKKRNQCRICLVNDALTRGCWVLNEGTSEEQTQKIATCGVCFHLNWKSVARLLGLERPERLRLIKRWWTPRKRQTTLRLMYPGVDWDAVAI